MLSAPQRRPGVHMCILNQFPTMHAFPYLYAERVTLDRLSSDNQGRSEFRTQMIRVGMEPVVAHAIIYM